MDRPACDPRTEMLHLGWEPDGFSHATNVPIYLTNAYDLGTTERGRRLFSLEESGDLYTRLSNPTTTVFETRMAALEKGAAAAAFSSGHAAIYALMLTLCEQGDNFVSSNCIYGGAINMFSHTLSRSGIGVTFVHPSDPAGFEAAIDDRTKCLFAESMGNPTCDLVDVDALAEIAHRHGIPLVIDNTFTPYLFCPAEHGADVVVTSATKYIGGQGAVMGGVVVDVGSFPWTGNERFSNLWRPNPSYHGISFAEAFGPAALAGMLRACMLRDLGACLSPFNSYQFLKGLETLAIRMDYLSASSRRVAEHLDGHPAVERVNSPMVPSSPYYELGRRLFPKGFGGMLSFEIRGGREAGGKFIDSLRLLGNVANLGDSISLVSHPATTTHSQLTDEELAACGISAGTVRLSLGLEATEDVLADIDAALEASQA